MATASSISRSLITKLRGSASLSYLPHKCWGSPSPPSSSFCSSAIAGSSVSDSVSASSCQSENQKRWTKWLLFVPGAITFGLGTWQIFRRQDKVKMLEYRQERLKMEPLKFNYVTPSSENLNSLEFRRVACQGVFDEKRSIFVGPRSRSISGVTENGYYMITPLMPIANDPESVKSPVLVNRGWVPRSWRDKFLRPNKDIEEPSPPSVEKKLPKKHWWNPLSTKMPEPIEDQIPAVTALGVIGVVRGSENPSIFVPENDPRSPQWFYVDVPAIARASGLSEDTLYMEDVNENVNPSNPYPIQKDVNTLIRSSVMPQDHLNYTLTWYSLSGAVTFMAFKRLRQKKTRR